MYRTTGAPRRGALLGLLIAFVVAVMVPSVALAYTASYSNFAPKKSSSSLVSTPTISVTIYAPYGVKGSTNYSLYLDGVKVKPSISYTSKYKKFKLTYRCPSPLKVGSHKVTVKIKDLKRRSSSSTWSFSVLAPPPPPAPADMTVTITSNACLTCHLSYPASHPMTACTSCHGPNGPLVDEPYGSWDDSAHTPGCAAEEPCHGGDGGFPHVLSSNCMSCHDGRYPAIPKSHGAFDPAAHVSTETFCAGSTCHDSSLSVEHFKHTVNGVPLSCETCHSNPDPKIRAALTSGSTACSSCHDLAAKPHSGTAEAHAYAVPNCSTGNGCHKAADVVVLHEGACTSCHAPDRTLTTNCNSCHPAQPHPDFDLVHTAGPLGCTTAACHSTNVIAIHTVGMSAPGCPACHAEGQPPLTLRCETDGCHATASASHTAHPVAPAAEPISIGGVSYGIRPCSDCHTPLDLIGLHSGRCTSCHAAASRATMSAGCAQTACHATGALAKHAGIEAAHTLASTPTCVAAGCHAGGTNVAAIHAATLGANATAPGCAACHTPGTDPVIACATAGCHGPSDPRPMANAHPKMTPGHTSGLPSACLGAGCHAADLTGLHAAARGCATCHGPGRTLVKDCATEGCHSKPSIAHGAHPVSPAAEPISIGGVSYGTRPCSDCHTPLDLIGLHQSRCSACHGGPATTATMGGGCAQTACHATGTLAKHAGIEAAHTLAGTPTCVAAGCHAGGKDVAAIHAATLGANANAPGCAACHTPGTDPVIACATVGCHGPSDSHPMGNAHPKMTPGHTVDLLGTCIGARCHVADLTALHAPADGCRTCHGPGATLAKSCVTTGCHIADIPASGLHPTYDADHTTAGTGCTAAACHEKNAITIHTTGDKNPGCAACHASEKPELTLDCGTTGCHPTLPLEHDSHSVVVPGAVIRMGVTDFGVHECSECHAPFELISLHRGSCSSCHGVGSPTVTFDGGCAQGSCHTSGALAMHGGATSSHELEAVSQCAGVGCHAGGTNVAALHVSRIDGSAGPGCAACHAPGADLTLVCATEGCHGAADSHPASNPHPKMTAGHTTELPSTCVAGGCHASDLAALHSVRGNCAACHGAGKPTTKTCSTTGCHISTISSLALHPEYVSGHTAPADGCTKTGCHATSAITLHTSGTDAPGCGACHASGKPKLTLVCETSGCHDGAQADHEAHPVAPADEAVTISGVSFGTHACSECHAPLDLIDLHASRCSACHTVTGNAATFAGGCVQGACHTSGALTKHGAIDDGHVGATASCTDGTGCHGGGTNVAAIHKAEGCATCHAPGRTPTKTCSTVGCHGSADTHPFAAPHPKMTPGHTTGLPEGCAKTGCHPADLTTLHAAKSGCATCHWNGKNATKTCEASGCHDSGISAMHTSHPASVAPAGIKINGLTLAWPACSTCHASMDLQVIHGGSSGCGACHPGPATAVGTWDGGCAQAACHGPSSTRPMHGGVDAAHTLPTQPGCTTSAAVCHQGNSNVGGRDFALMHFMAPEKCVTCHKQGQTLPADCAACHEQWATGDHQPDHGYCNDCHAPFKWDPTKTQMGSGDPSGYPGAFHWNMFDAAWTVKIGRAVIRPGYPFGDYTMLRMPGPLGKPGPYSTTYMERTVTYDCDACHDGPGKTWVHPSYNNFTCGNTGDCHEHHWVWDAAQGSESYVHYTPPSNWIVPSMGW